MVFNIPAANEMLFQLCVGGAIIGQGCCSDGASTLPSLRPDTDGCRWDVLVAKLQRKEMSAGICGNGYEYLTLVKSQPRGLVCLPDPRDEAFR